MELLTIKPPKLEPHFTKKIMNEPIKYYLADGGVIRYNNISCSTVRYKGMGGIQFN